jgi:hypothetical protein
MKIKKSDHPSTLNRAGLGARLKDAGYALVTRGPTRLQDGSIDNTVELEVHCLSDGAEPDEAQAAEVSALIMDDSGEDAPGSSDSAAEVYIRGGNIYAEDQDGNKLLLGTIPQG